MALSRSSCMLGAALLALPGAASAAPFSGLSLGIGAASHGMGVEAEFSGDSSSEDEVASEFGPALDLGIGARTSENVHVQAGVRAYSAELDTRVYPDDRVEMSGLRSVYGQVGYVLGDRNAIYGTFEFGRADVTVSKEQHEDSEVELDSFGFGVGYKRAFDDHVELFVELVNRDFQDVEVEYETGPDAGERTEYEIVGANVTAGFTFRF